MDKSTNSRRGARPWVLIAAYDVSMGASSEGHVAISLLRRLCKDYRIVLVTRRNNRDSLLADKEFPGACPGVRVLGYDLPKWASWWKRGARFYQAYAYFWQMAWPLAIEKRSRLIRTVQLVHVLNFHNDSIPSLAWRFGLPVVWGPINHNELAESWRRMLWPKLVSLRHIVSFFLRRALWLFDPFLRLQIIKSRLIVSAGDWVDTRLALGRANKVLHRSQLGVQEDEFRLVESHLPRQGTEDRVLVCAGRLDWIKGLDLTIEAMCHLPPNYTLKLIGKGPAEQQLRGLAKRLDIDGRVSFYPPVPRHALSEHYANADLFVFPSAEVAGLAWVEALACGLPVVAFDGLTEVSAASRLLPGIWLAVGGGGRPGRVKALASAIEVAAASPSDRMGLRVAALEHYSWDALGRVLGKAYQEVTGTAG